MNTLDLSQPLQTIFQTIFTMNNYDRLRKMIASGALSGLHHNSGLMRTYRDEINNMFSRLTLDQQQFIYSYRTGHYISALNWLLPYLEKNKDDAPIVHDYLGQRFLYWQVVATSRIAKLDRIMVKRYPEWDKARDEWDLPRLSQLLRQELSLFEEERAKKSKAAIGNGSVVK